MKNRIYKRLLSWLLLFCIMITNVPTVAFAVDDGTIPPRENSEPSPTVTVSPTPEPSAQPSTEPSSAPDPVEPSGTSQDQKDENEGGEPSPVPSQVPDQQEQVKAIADVTEIASITVKLPNVQSIGNAPALTMDNFIFYDQDRNRIDFSGSIRVSGSYNVGDGTNYSYSINGIPDQGGREKMWLQVVNTPGYEFSVVGAGAYGLLPVEKIGAFYYLADNSSITVSVVEMLVGPTAIFDIEWHDMLNAAGLRPDIKDIIAVYISEDDVLEEREMLDSHTLVFKDLGSKITDDVETVAYKLDAPIVEGMTRVPAEYIKIAFLREQIPVAYTSIVSNSAYSGIPSTALKDVVTEAYGAVAEATEPVAITLEQYNVVVMPKELSEDALANFKITAKRGEEDYTDFVQSATYPFVCNGFVKLDADGNHATYTVTWPAEVDDYVLISEETRGVVNLDNQSLEASPKYAKKFKNSGDDAESSRNVIWFDTDASYNHSGQLSIEIPVTVGDKTIPVAPAWDPEKGCYVHKWTAQNMKDLGINLDPKDMDYFLAEMEDLIIEDTGDNNLNRTLKATTTKSITVPDGERRKEGYIFQLGTIDVTDVSYSPESDSSVIQDYAIGTDPSNHKTLTLYPMTYVGFKFDVRAGDYTAKYALEYLSSKKAIQLLLKDSATEDWQEAPIAAGYFKDKFNIKDIERETVAVDNKHASYRILLPLYDVNKRQISYAFDSVSGNTITLYPDIWLKVEYDNTAVPGMGTKNDRTYEDGTMVFILTGVTDYTATKIWADDGSPETIANRPEATYTLWRYSEKNGDYTTAAMQMIPQGTRFVEEAKIDTNYNTYDIKLNTLDRFDSDGYPYVYFIRESLSGGTNYEKIYGVVGEGPNGEKQISDTLPYEGDRKGSDRSIYDNGTITNRRSEPITAKVTKNWKAAYYQDSLDKLSVEMTLYAQHKYPQGENDEAFVVDTVTIGGFDEFNSSRYGELGINRFDDHGHELEFWWEETAVIQDGQRILVKATADNNDVKYTLPLNTETMAADSYSDSSKEYFVAKVQQDANGNATVTNSLKGTTEYWLLKEWRDMEKPDDAKFQLVKIDENGKMTEVPGKEGEYTIPADYPQYATPDENGNFSSGWIKAWVNLEKYDANGNRYGYIAKEKESDDYQTLESYGHNVDDDSEEEANSFKVINSPVGTARDIDLRKVWLDDTANTARDSVYFNVYTEDGQIVYGTDRAGVGLLGSEPIEITATNEWTKPGVDVTLWDVGGALYTELDIPSDKAEQGIEAVNQYKSDHLYDGDFYVREVRVGENNPVDTVNLTKAGYPTVTSNGTDFVVIYNTNPDSTDHTKGTNVVDEEGFYTVTNLRVGVTDLTVTKKWYDDKEVDRSSFVATFTVKCDEDKTRVTDLEDNLGYAKVHEAVSPDERQKITNAEGEQVSITQKIDTEDNVSTITFYNLPLYDEYGRILHYSVEENLQGADPNHDGSYVQSSSTMRRDPVNGNNSKVIASQTFTNTFKNTTDISFDLLWLDDYRVNNSQRPDVFLYLYRTKNTYDENGVITEIVRNDFVEYLWSGKNNEKKTEDWWRYTFKGLDEYDEYGNKIYYYATIQTHANREILDYIAPQYAKGQSVNNYEGYLKNAHSSVSKIDGEYVVSHSPVSDIIGKYNETIDVLKQENTFVVQLKNDINVVGHKVWEQIPNGFPVKDLPLLSFKLYRSQTTYETEHEISSIDPNGFCTAAIIRYESPSQEYNFKLNWYGINEHDGSLVSADTVIYDVDDNSYRTALEIWSDMTDFSEELCKELYGQPLPKYDDLGEMYDYSIIEIVADSKDSIHIAYEELENAVNGYNIINTFNTTTTNKRPISVSKEWLYNGKSIAQAAEGFKYMYPSAVTYKLYRFYKIDYEKGYSKPELMGTVDLTREDVNKGITKKAFEDQLVYAPNGNNYIYYVSEDIIKGYNTEKPDDRFPLMEIDGEATSVTCESGVNNWPSVIGGKDTSAWYSPAFILNEKESSSNNAGNVDISNNAGNVDISNNYTGLPQTYYEGVKTWKDYSNQFGTRPDSITLTLYRKTDTISSQQKVATIVLNNDQTTHVTPVENVNVTSDQITADNTVSGDDWSFTIECLDGYAPTGEEWIYSVVETLPDQYQNKYQNSVDGNKITNNFYTSYTGTKDWVDLNDDIAYPEVKVKLQVSTDGVKWNDAKNVFGTKLGNYSYTAALNHSNKWKATFKNLPVGTGRGNDFVKYQYRLLETNIGRVPVTYDDESSASPEGQTGDGKYTVGLNTNKVIENRAETTELSITKKWKDDSNNAFGTRNSKNGMWSVSYIIKRSYESNGAAITETVKVPDGSAYVLTITGTDEQESVTETVEDLPSYTPSGEKYKYFAVELDVNGEEIENGKHYNGAYETTYENSYAASGDRTVATNRLILVELEVTKMWMGEDNEDNKSIRPMDIKLTLKQNNETVNYPYEIKWDKSADGGYTWFAVFTMLPMYDASGVDYEYTVSEVKQGGYRVPVVDDFEPRKDGNQAKVIKNIQTCFSIDKLDEKGNPINDVTLVFESTAAIYNPKLDGSHFYQLTWSRNVNGVASYEIRYSSSDEDFSEAVLWASGDDSDIYGLPEGTYTLTDETIIPRGYYASSLDGGFTLSSESGVQHLVVSRPLVGAGENDDSMAYLQVPNLPTSFSISKQDKNANNIDRGWVFTIQPVGESRFVPHADDENVTSARPFNAGDKWTGVLIVDNVYKLNEEVAPPGYKLNSESVYFKLDKRNTVIICDEDGNAIDSTDPAASGETGVLIFKDEPFDFVVNKYTSTQNNTLITARETTFRLYDITDSQNGVAVKLDGKPNPNIVTSNGTLTLSSTATEPKLTVGHTYRLVEHIAPDGYILPDPKPSIEFTFGMDGKITRDANSKGAVVRQENTIDFTDNPIRLVLTKKDSGDRIQPETILPGVSFTLYDTTVTPKEPVGTATTDSKGEITFGAKGESKLLVIGGHSYELSETEPNGYTAVGTIYFSVTTDGKIVIDEEKNSLPDGVTKDGDYNLVAVNTRNRGTLEITKKDGFTGDALNNIHFELYRANEFNEDGSPKNFFERIIAIITGNSYILQKSFDWSAASGGDLKVEYVGDGKIIVEDLDWGRYKLVETAAEGYILDKTEYFFTVNASNTDSKIEIDENGLIKGGVINNTPIRVQVNKVAEGNYDVNLAGAVYKLYHVKEDGTETEIPATSTDGALATWKWNRETGIGTASRLSPGTYRLVETEAPPGYTKAEDITFTVDEYGVVKTNGVKLGANNTIPLIYAEDTGFEISIEKRNAEGENLEAVFNIYDVTIGKPVEYKGSEEIRSLDSGALVIGSTETEPALQVGHRYVVEEIVAPKGYILPIEHPKVQFTIGDKGVLTPVNSTEDAGIEDNNIFFTDKPISLKLVKYDNGDHVVKQHPLGEVEFKLYSVNGNEERFVDSAKTTANGEITFGAEGESMLPVIGGQEYVLVETPKDGYTPLGKLRFKVTFDGKIKITEPITGYTLLEGETELKAENERKLGTLTLLKKEDSVSNEALNNIKFELYRAKILDEDGEPLTWFERLLGLITGNGYVLTKEFSWTGRGNDGITDYVAEDGQIVEDGQIIVENLDWGVYKLVETVADGYILPDDPEKRTYTFVIDENNLHATVKFGDEVLEDNTIFNQPNRVIVQKVDAEDNTRILSGAEYELYYVKDKAGTAIERKIINDDDDIATWAWNSDEGTGEATHLSPGTYKLVEIKSPYGYIIEDPVFFEIDARGVVTVDGEVVDSIENTPVVKAADTKTRFSFTKHELYNEGCADGYSIDPNATRILDGVTFTAYEDKELTKKIRDMDAVSVNGVVEFIGLPLGTNYIKETATVPGHVLDDTLYMVIITPEGDGKLLYAVGGSEVKDNTVINDVYRGSFSFHKVSELDNNTIIPGAVYGLYKTVMLDFGPVNIPYEVLVTEATADEFGYVEFTDLLMDVEYTIRELSVPAGCYVSANPIVFKLTWTESGVVTTIIDDGEGTIAEDSNGYIWLEPQTVIEFLKTDPKGVPLPGAVLQLRDKDGNVVMVPDFNGEMVESWVSTKTALVVTGILTAGKTYWLYELDAPDGYNISKPIKFTVPDEPIAPDQDFVVTITMKNYPYPVTGDDSNLFGYMAAMGTSGLGLIFLAIFSRHRKRKSV